MTLSEISLALDVPAQGEDHKSKGMSDDQFEESRLAWLALTPRQRLENVIRRNACS